MRLNGDENWTSAYEYDICSKIRKMKCFYTIEFKMSG